jgi:hypothetical protein
VHDLKPAYIETSRHHIKDEIARQVVDAVKEKNGRFLRRVESLRELEELGVPDEVQAWALVDDETVLQKVKQTFRDDDKSITVAKDKHTVATASHDAGATISGSPASFITQKPQQRQITEQPNRLQNQSAFPSMRSSNLLLGPTTAQQQLTAQQLLETLALGQESQSLIQRIHQERQHQSQMALLASLLQPRSSTSVDSGPLTTRTFASPFRSSDIIPMLLQTQSHESMRDQALLDYQTLLERAIQNSHGRAIQNIPGPQNDPTLSLISNLSNNPFPSVSSLDTLRSQLIGQNDQRTMEQLLLLAANSRPQSTSTRRVQRFHDSSLGLGASLQASTLGTQHPANPLMHIERAAPIIHTAVNDVATGSRLSDNYLSRGYSLGEYISTTMSERNKREREDEMKSASLPPDQVVTDVKKSRKNLPLP